MPPFSITGLMTRRLLINWRVAPALAAAILPPRLRPKLVSGFAIAGLCLVRLAHVRPAGLPPWTGFTSENLAVRMGVEWDTPAGGRGSVLIVRRETDSRLNALLGGRIGYGAHRRGAFNASDDGRSARITVFSHLDGHYHHAAIQDAATLPPATVFRTLGEADSFFRGSEIGYSPSTRRGNWDGLRLHLHRWDLHPARLLDARSSLIDALFAGNAVLDSAFIMRNIEHTWTPCGTEHFGELRATRVHRHAA